MILRNLPSWNRTNNLKKSIKPTVFRYAIKLSGVPYYTVKLSLSPFSLNIKISYLKFQSDNYKYTIYSTKIKQRTVK